METPLFTQVGSIVAGAAPNFYWRNYYIFKLSLEKVKQSNTLLEILSIRKQPAVLSSESGFCCCLKNSFSATVVSPTSLEGLIWKGHNLLES